MKGHETMKLTEQDYGHDAVTMAKALLGRMLCRLRLQARPGSQVAFPVFMRTNRQRGELNDNTMLHFRSCTLGDNAERWHCMPRDAA
jgi:hypothetical protein